MATQNVVENIKCPNCNNIVPKQANCSKCGQALNATPMTPQESAKKIEYPISRTRAYQQFLREHLLKENPKQVPPDQSQKVEKPPQESVKNDAPKVSESVVPEAKMMSQNVETVVMKVEKASDEKKPPAQNADLRSYTPDLYAKEIVEKMAKQVKYEVNLVQLFKEGQVPEEIFTRLFNSMTDEITALIARRGEMTKELSGLMNGYKSTVLSAQQGMKLLDLRKSLDDVTEEEYRIKSAALNWDVDHYGERISEGRLKADYLRSLGGLIPVEEVNDLKKIAASCMDASSMKHVNDSVREKIRKAIQEASSILNEIYNS